MTAPRGFRTLTSNLGVKDDTADFALVVADAPCAAAGLYTQSRFAGPSVTLSREVTATGRAQAVVVISKNANVANGAPGVADAESLQHLAATLAGVEPCDVVVASTGVIGRPYPMERIATAMGALPIPSGADFAAVAEAIMTTDTHPKLATRTVGDITILGVAKGVGMIEPNMATLLTFFFTDAELSAPDLDRAFREAIATTFNALSIDTDTSTSDTAVILASGAAGPVDPTAFQHALHEVALELTLMIAGDGEGATTVIETTVTGARDDAQAKRVAKAIVNSPLVKTAVHGADPNWGRIAMAVGKGHDETDIDPDRVTITIGGHHMYPPAAGEAALAAAAQHLRQPRVLLEVDLGIAEGTSTAYGCDLTDGYVRINADYTT